jgi:hypothetical protein
VLIHYRTKIEEKNETHEIRLDWLEQAHSEAGVEKEGRGDDVDA